MLQSNEIRDFVSTINDKKYGIKKVKNSVLETILSSLKIKLLQNENGYENLTDSIIRERKDAIKQKIVDLFSYTISNISFLINGTSL